MSPNSRVSGGSLKSSPLELFYFIWLVAHAYVAVFIDCQVFYPPWLLAFFPQFLLDLPPTWDAISGDPLVKSLQADWKGSVNEYTWFWALSVGLELCVQIPTSIVAAIGLWKNNKATWIVILVYGSTTAASLLPCISTIWYAPLSGTILSDPTVVTLTQSQKNIIIGSYAPYFFVPLWMAVDASLRLWHIVNISEQGRLGVKKAE